MPARKSAKSETPAEPFDFSAYRERKHYVWREIERTNDKPTLRVRLLDLNIREAEDIPTGVRVPWKDTMQAMAPYIAEWDLELENHKTGKVEPVPAPGSDEAAERMGEDAWQLLDTLDADTLSLIVAWLKNPSYMEAKGKNLLTSEPTAKPSDAATRAKT